MIGLSVAGTPNGLKTTGWSANFDCQILPNALWPIELKSLISKDKVFAKGNEQTKTNTFVSTSLAVSF